MLYLFQTVPACSYFSLDILTVQRDGLIKHASLPAGETVTL